MGEQVDYYDLGDVDALPEASRAMAAPGGRRRAKPRNRSVTAAVSSWPAVQALASTLSLFVPGLGQAIQRDSLWSLLLASWAGLTIAGGWAILATQDRVAGLLGLFGLPAEATFWGLTLLLGILAFVHVVGVVHAHGPNLPGTADRAPHPIVSSMASLVVPGWGQILNHQRGRAAVFLAGAWLAAGCWLVSLASRFPSVREIAPALPPALASGVGPVALIVLTSGIWSAAVYDAAASAAAKRGRV